MFAYPQMMFRLMPKRPKIIILVTRLEAQEGMNRGSTSTMMQATAIGSALSISMPRAITCAAGLLLLLHQNTFLPMSPLGLTSSTVRNTIQAKNSATCGT